MDESFGTRQLPPPPPCPQGRLYTVRTGDTLYRIARRFNVPLDALIRANPQIRDPNLIYPGQQICVPVAVPGPPGALGACSLALNPQVPEAFGGVLWLRTLNGRTHILVAGIELPPPANFGETRYTARFTWDGNSYDLPLSEFSPGVWVGYAVERLPAEFFNAALFVYPGPVLGGNVARCD